MVIAGPYLGGRGSQGLDLYPTGQKVPGRLEIEWSAYSLCNHPMAWGKIKIPPNPCPIFFRIWLHTKQTRFGILLVIREASYFAQRWTFTTSIFVYDCHLGLPSCFCQIVRFDTHLVIHETILIQTQKYNFKKIGGGDNTCSSLSYA